MILYTTILDRAITVCPSLTIIPEWARYNKPYHVHEERHAEQQRHIGVFRFWWKYITDTKFRQGAELDAFREQILHGASLEHCAWQLSTQYGLGITYEQALLLIID